MSDEQSDPIEISFKDLGGVDVFAKAVAEARNVFAGKPADFDPGADDAVPHVAGMSPEVVKATMEVEMRASARHFAFIVAENEWLEASGLDVDPSMQNMRMVCELAAEGVGLDPDELLGEARDAFAVFLDDTVKANRGRQN